MITHKNNIEHNKYTNRNSHKILKSIENADNVASDKILRTQMRGLLGIRKICSDTAPKPQLATCGHIGKDCASYYFLTHILVGNVTRTKGIY